MSLTSEVLQVNVSVHLIGQNSFPVSAVLTVSQRAAAGVSNALLPVSVIMTDALFWDTNESGLIRTVTIKLPQKVSALSNIAIPQDRLAKFTGSDETTLTCRHWHLSCKLIANPNTQSIVILYKQCA